MSLRTTHREFLAFYVTYVFRPATGFVFPFATPRLEAENKSLVSVDYNVFATFGHEGRYTLRSVDGVPLAVGNRIIRKTREFGGQILLNGDATSSCP